MSLISIKHLVKKYGSLTVLKDVNAEIEKGEVISVIGPSGTGKSTLLRCINRLDEPTGGEIWVGGINIMDKNADIYKIRQKIGMVFQSFNLFEHLMIIENIMLGPVELLGIEKKTAYEEGMKLLKMVGLGEKADAYPDELSGGQRQRVAIVRALAMKPEILLFDEPTSALDPTMVGEVLSVIRNLAKEGLTMMIVTHEMKFARDVSTRIFYMDEGIIYEDGPPEQIFDNPKKEKTRAFIKRLRVYSYTIKSKDFDFYNLNSEIEAFAQKQLLSHKKINNIQLLFEELCIQHILKILPKEGFELEFLLSCSEENEVCELIFSFEGKRYNPFESEDTEDISMMIINRIAASSFFEYNNGINRMGVCC